MRLRALSALLAITGVLMYPATASAHETADSECDAEAHAVLGDRADWAAVELVAWVLDTECLLDSGNRKNNELPEATAEMYDDQSVIVVGGTAAVPESKLNGLDVEERLWGSDRLETMRAVVRWADQQRGSDEGIGETLEQSGTGPQAGRLNSWPCGIYRITLEVSNNGATDFGSNVILTANSSESDYFDLLVNDIAQEGRWEKNIRLCPGEEGVSEPFYFELEVDQAATWTFTVEELTA